MGSGSTILTREPDACHAGIQEAIFKSPQFPRERAVAELLRFNPTRSMESRFQRYRLAIVCTALKIAQRFNAGNPAMKSIESLQGRPELGWPNTVRNVPEGTLTHPSDPTQR